MQVNKLGQQARQTELKQGDACVGNGRERAEQVWREEPVRMDKVKMEIEKDLENTKKNAKD